jgi:hypothetical protein
MEYRDNDDDQHFSRKKNIDIVAMVYNDMKFGRAVKLLTCIHGIEWKSIAFQKANKVAEVTRCSKWLDGTRQCSLQAPNTKTKSKSAVDAHKYPGWD